MLSLWIAAHLRSLSWITDVPSVLHSITKFFEFLHSIARLHKGRSLRSAPPESASWISFSLSSVARLALPVLASSFAHRVSPVRKSAAMTCYLGLSLFVIARSGIGRARRARQSRAQCPCEGKPRFSRASDFKSGFSVE